MIKYQLICDLSHEFEGWFQTSSSFDAQIQSELITCPVCGSADVRRALMTPNLASPKRRRRSFADDISSTNVADNGAVDNPSLPSNQTNSRVSRDIASGASPSVTEIGQAMAQLRQLQRKITAEYRDVGTEFASEARKIHYGESAPENIYGQSSDEEREALADEGIDVVAMPWLPPEH
tara:strand:+ start:238 stop:771 length:534 start_codon:yes stop_codon:yes gene_type:complete